MPYEIIRQENEWCVRKTGTEEIEWCHDTEEEAQAHLTALNLNVDHEEDEGPAVVRALRVKAVAIGDDWALEVLSAPYGGPNRGKDSHGEYFSPRTNFYENDNAPLPLVAYYHGYTPDGKPQGEPEIIGRAVRQWRDGQGLWHRVILDKTKDLARRVWEAAQKGIARASTGVAGYMGRTKPDGEITHWLIGELSIWDAEGNRQPANQYAVARPAVKMLLRDAGFIEPETQDGAQGVEPSPSDVSQAPLKTEVEPIREEPIEMADETNVDQTVSNLVSQQIAKWEAERKAQADAEAARQKEIDDAVATAKAEAEEAAKKAIEEARVKWEAEQAPARRLPDFGAPTVAQFGNVWKYDNLSAGDLSVMIGVLKSAQRNVSENALKALAIRATQEENTQQMARTRAAMAMEGLPVKANELNQSTLSTYGDEWIGVTYSTELWDKIRSMAGIVAKIPAVEVPQGSESIVIPLQSTSPTFYKVAQASAQDTNTLGKATYTVTSSKLSTGNQTLTVGKLGARTLYTGELEEDSLIPWMSELRMDLEREGAEILESLVIDGDTATGATTNINDIAGTPAGTEYYLVLNGFRKLALVTNTGNSRSAGTLTLEDFLETLKLMGIAGKNAMDKTKVSFIIDPWVHWKALELAELKTRDVFSSPTIENGMLMGLYGHEVIPTYNMHRFNADSTYGLKANTSGKVDVDTASNNTTGSILAVRWDQWRLGWKRRMTFETQRIPQADATDIVMLMRVGLTYRDTDASAISYGVTV